MESISTLHYRSSILDRLIKLFPKMNEEQLSQAYTILEKSSDKQLNRYWALIKLKDLETLKEIFNEQP